MVLDDLDKLLKKLQKDLDYIGFDINARDLFKFSMIGTILICFLSVFYEYIILFAPIPFLAIFMVPKYFSNKKTREIEYFLSDALYQASSLSSFASVEEILKSIADSGYGPLSEEFEKAYWEIQTGASFEDSLKSMIKRNRSELLEKCLRVLILGYETGANISDALKEIAEDISQTFDLYRQRSASMTVEKYTLLMAGGIMVPLILGSMISLVQGLNLSALSGLGFGLKESLKNSILNNAVLGNQIYIGIYAIMSSVFVAFQENKIENALVYSAIILPLSLILFNIVKNINFLGLF